MDNLNLSKTYCMCEFVIWGDFDPSEITAYLGITPTKSWRRGDVLLPNPLPRKESYWKIDTGYENAEDIGSSIKRIYSVLSRQKKELGRLKRIYNLTYHIEVIASLRADTQAAIKLDRNQIRLFTDLEISLLAFDVSTFMTSKRYTEAINGEPLYSRVLKKSGVEMTLFSSEEKRARTDAGKTFMVDIATEQLQLLEANSIQLTGSVGVNMAFHETTDIRNETRAFQEALLPFGNKIRDFYPDPHMTIALYIKDDKVPLLLIEDYFLKFLDEIQIKELVFEISACWSDSYLAEYDRDQLVD